MGVDTASVAAASSVSRASGRASSISSRVSSVASTTVRGLESDLMAERTANFAMAEVSRCPGASDVAVPKLSHTWLHMGALRS
jgi:hypothetical protein